MIRIVVNFDKQAIGAGSNGGARHRRNLVASSGAMGRIGDDREMRKFLDDRNSGDVQGVAEISFKGADAALTKNHVVISAGENVFGAEEKLLNSGGHAALQEHGLLHFAESAEKEIVLHVAGAYLEHVHVVAHHLDLRRVHHFADDEQFEFVSGVAHEF